MEDNISDLISDPNYVTMNGSGMNGNMTVGFPTMGPLLYQYVYVTLLNAVIFIVGVMGNILVIQVAVRIRSMWTRMNFFLVSLSVADLQLLIVGLPVAVLEFYSKDRWYIGEGMCRLVPFLENASHHCSVMTLLVIGFERYYAICHPLRETARSRITSPSLLIPVTWILSCIVALPMAFSNRIVHATFYDGSVVDLCRIDGKSQLLRSYILFIFSVFLVVPLLLLTALYTAIILTLENSMKNCSSSSSGGPSGSISNGNQGGRPSLSSDRRRFRKDTNDQHNVRMVTCRRQVIRMMVAVMAFYFLCLVPMRSFQLWNLLASQEDIDSLGLEGTLNIVYTVRMLIYLNCAGNPIIYGLISANFRNSFKQSMTCRHSDQLDGYRYNFVYYNTAKRRSANLPEVIGTPTEMSPCRRNCENTRAGCEGNGRGSRHSQDSKKIMIYNAINSHNAVNSPDNTLHGATTAEILSESVLCGNKAQGKTNCTNGKKGTFV